MATLTGSTIATTYDRLLSLDSGGLNGASLVNMTDGNGSATACISITDNATGKAVLSIDGSHASGTALYIDNSASDGDVSVEWQLSGTTTWLMGIEDGSSDSLKICHDSTMGTDERLTFLTASTVFNQGSGDIDFRVEGNGDANLLFCDGGEDRVGIGTATPKFSLQVSHATTGKLALTRQDTSGISADVDVGEIYFGQSGDSNDPRSGAKITATTSEVWDDGGTDAGTDLEFYTCNAGTNVLDLRMLIRDNGRVAIGSTNSAKMLTVANSTSTEGIAVLRTDTNGIVSSAAPLGNIFFGTNEGTDSAGVLAGDGDQRYGAQIQCKSDGDWSDGSDYNSLLNFMTTTSGAIAPSTKMTVLANGYVGIGATAPESHLTVRGTATDGTREIEILCTAAGTITSGGTLMLNQDSSSAEVMADNDRMGMIQWSGTEDTSHTMVVAGKILVAADEVWSGSANGAYMAFYTNSTANIFNTGATLYGENMRIDKDGLVGIGVTVGGTFNGISAKLHVVQQASGGAKPVLMLNQLDVDDSFIDFLGTSAADSTKSISSSTATGSAKFGAIRISINGTDKWIRVWDTAV